MKWKFTSMNWMTASNGETSECDTELAGKMHELAFIFIELFGIKRASNYIWNSMLAADEDRT